MGKAFRRQMRHKFLRLASRSSVRLPVPILRGGLQGAAWLSQFTKFEQRTLNNLRHAYGNELSAQRLHAIAKGVRKHTARMAEEWLQLSGLRQGINPWLEDRVEVHESVDILRSAQAQGRGVIVVTGHLGNWEFLAATLHRIGLFGAVVGLEKRLDPTADWLLNLRRNYGVETIPQHSHPRALLRVLQKGQLLGLLCDLEVKRLAGEHLPFFGKPALTMTAPAALARARKLPLIPVRCVLPYEGAPRYLLQVEEPIHFPAHLPKKEANSVLMTRVNQVFEGWIRETPEQWAWHQHRWRTGPGELDGVPLAGR